MIAALLVAAYSLSEDDMVKKRYGTMIQNIIEDEVKKSYSREKVTGKLRDELFSTLNFQNLERSRPSEVEQLRKEIRELRKELRTQEWEDVKERVNNAKKLQKERLRMQIDHILPLVQTVDYQYGSPWPEAMVAMNSDESLSKRSRRHRRVAHK